jgi:hypothetical protein
MYGVGPIILTVGYRMLFILVKIDLRSDLRYRANLEESDTIGEGRWRARC